MQKITMAIVLNNQQFPIQIRIPSSISVFLTSIDKSNLTLERLSKYQSFESKLPLALAKVGRSIVIGGNSSTDIFLNNFKSKTPFKVYFKKFKGSPEFFTSTTTKALIRKSIKSLQIPRRISLLLTGVGFRFSLNKTRKSVVLQIRLGYSHHVFLQIPPEINIVCIGGSKLIIAGHYSRKVNALAALIRSQKVPDCYKGKGICYEYEKISLKDGKTKV